MNQLSCYKRWISLFMFFGFMWAGSAMAQGWVHDVSGDVKAQLGTGPARGVAKNELVVNNTILTTGPKSFAILKFPDGQVVAIKENSTFHVQNYQYDAKDPKKGNVLFALLRGGAQAVTGTIGRDNRDNWKLTTPVATAGIRGTSFIIAQAPNGQWFAQVAEGSVNLSTSAGTVTATAGQTFSISATGVLTPVATTAVPAGTFTQFQTFVLPAATPAVAPVAGAPVAGAAVGGLTGAAIGIAAAIAAAVAVAAAGDDETTGTGTGTGTR